MRGYEIVPLISGMKITFSVNVPKGWGFAGGEVWASTAWYRPTVAAKANVRALRPMVRAVGVR